MMSRMTQGFLFCCLKKFCCLILIFSFIWCLHVVCIDTLFCMYGQRRYVLGIDENVIYSISWLFSKEGVFWMNILNHQLMDYFFKALAAGLIPVFLWVNSLSVEVAVIRNDLSGGLERVKGVEAELKIVHADIQENQASLREMKVTVGFIKDILTEIKDDIQSPK